MAGLSLLSRAKAGHIRKVLSSSPECAMCPFPSDSRYIEVYVSRKHQMQRHVPHGKQVMAYSRGRREYESISEGEGWRDTGGSPAEGEISESLPPCHECSSRPLRVTPRGHGFLMREGGTASSSDGFSLHPQNCAGKEQRAPGTF